MNVGEFQVNKYVALDLSHNLGEVAYVQLNTVLLKQRQFAPVVIRATVGTRPPGLGPMRGEHESSSGSWQLGIHGL